MRACGKAIEGIASTQRRARRPETRLTECHADPSEQVFLYRHSPPKTQARSKTTLLLRHELPWPRVPREPKRIQGLLLRRIPRRAATNRPVPSPFSQDRSKRRE